MTEEEIHRIADFNVSGRFGRFSVDEHPVLVCQGFGDWTAFYQSGNFEVLINAHGGSWAGWWPQLGGRQWR